MDEQPMQGRVALVAGASKGIGASTAEAFARAGAAVVLGARNAEALQSVVARIESQGGRAIGVRTDVADVDSMRNLVDQALATYGRLDAAFNNATDGPLPAPLADIDPDEFDRGIATNIRGTFLGMKFEIPATTRRMILPERVLGMSGTIQTFLGRAILPMIVSIAPRMWSSISALGA